MPSAKVDIDRALYSPVKVGHTVSIAKALADRFISLRENDEVLVAGCGDGTEAAQFCDVFGTKTIGVDLSIHENQTLKNGRLQLQHEDLSKLPYPASTFSFIYCFHVLEHVPDHYVVLRELGRVLRPGGILLIGFPNKKRVLMYIRTHQRATISERVLWNLNDYKRKLEGTFENSLGAHAGFTQEEFIEDAHETFQNVVPIRAEYFKLKYHNQLGLINALIKMKLDEYLFPSNYFICTKGAGIDAQVEASVRPN
jgi:SAM-dependent methyltransferase